MILLAACTSPFATTETIDSAEPVEESGECAQVEVTDMPTVLRIRWTSESPVPARVVFDNGAGRTRETEWVEATEHEHLLVGLLPESDIAWSIEGEASCSGTSRTGALPPGLPDLTATLVDADASAGGLTVAPVITLDSAWLTLIDEDGRYVWAWSARAYPGMVVRGAPSLDGKSLVTNLQAVSIQDDGGFLCIPLDGSEESVIDTPGIHTDFVELGEGRYATIGWTIRAFDDRKILGDTIVEVEADGSQRVVWDVFDHFEPDLHQTWVKGFYVPDPEVEDWSHVNGIAWDEAAGDYLVTATFNNAVIRVDAASGAMEEVITPYGGTISAELDSIAQPHSVENLPENGLLIFNRRLPLDGTASCSSATELQIDETIASARVTWEYFGDECLHVVFLGGASRLSNGNTLVDWSSAGRIEEVTPDGEWISRWQLDAGAAFGFVQRLP